jgi:hypothetical protein
MKLVEKRVISANSLRSLCIENDWYTGGDCEEYENLLYNLAENKGNLTTDDVIAIASDILEHSETEMDLSVICYNVANACSTFFEEADEEAAPEVPEIVKFEVGKKYVYPSLYGGIAFWTCVSRTVTDVTFLEEDAVTLTTKKIEIFGEFGNIESAGAWEYHGEHGYITANR